MQVSLYVWPRTKNTTPLHLCSLLPHVMDGKQRLHPAPNLPPLYYPMLPSLDNPLPLAHTPLAPWAAAHFTCLGGRAQGGTGGLCPSIRACRSWSVCLPLSLLDPEGHARGEAWLRFGFGLGLGLGSGLGSGSGLESGLGFGLPSMHHPIACLLFNEQTYVHH